MILFVHGGPGDSMVPFAQLYRPWEKYFTVVQWDQRGAGKTFGRNGTDEAPMTMDRMVRDGIEVAEYLRAHLHKDKVILLAHSFGTVLGIQMVKRRPDLFAAYVGTGQVVAKAEKERILYARLMKKLEAAHDAEGIARLKTVTAAVSHRSRTAGRTRGDAVASIRRASTRSAQDIDSRGALCAELFSARHL